ncbi:hypothetical protein [Pseudomonas vlassakiae]|uniref:Uncharacterized protein n=1 Tax=Pseudomonas vlassakiae TaxID=485888 RepID=A0A923GDU0_9PSED|nr:hypothetical protein [Pseudomonas vlassakiae]MBV4540082.1 hypothetical protein [Pseudomonas vlassakiae]
MKGGKSLGALTEEEFTTMMLEFDVAGQWMLEQLKLRRANASTTVSPLPLVESLAHPSATEVSTAIGVCNDDIQAHDGYRDD